MSKQTAKKSIPMNTTDRALPADTICDLMSKRAIRDDWGPMKLMTTCVNTHAYYPSVKEAFVAPQDLYRNVQRLIQAAL